MKVKIQSQFSEEKVRGKTAMFSLVMRDRHYFVRMFEVERGKEPEWKFGYGSFSHLTPTKLELGDIILNMLEGALQINDRYDNIIIIDNTDSQSFVGHEVEIGIDMASASQGSEDERGAQMSEEVEALIRYRRRAISALQDAIDTVEKERDPMGLIGEIAQSLAEVHKGMALVSLEEHLKRV